ncbi:hypothetical protein NGB78_08010 [Staphylococcus arlettae]|uniref:hypothetical protein n=1 Tax=Staphylococcus TaxID=1279 RepID=UPI000D1B3BA7|nr:MULTISPECIES: hypothetical protein [Staphylococcus]KAB2481002.1 hypothetical protein F9B39_01695 [Staphylococcus sp. CH99b_3]MBF0738935.1 hypothetical protein [Staphylococcus arlettae]MBK3719516.1 hypothetical protein [Staphylococcus arlettae]MEB7422027.1 hypothetical protein [Staphylococcus arlettae]PTH18715.1 hypothetical protein BU602_12360 [Staphylococcus arlettae]
MRNKFISFLVLILLITFISSPITALANEYEDVDSIGTLDESINQAEQDNSPDYVPVKLTI